MSTNVYLHAKFYKNRRSGDTCRNPGIFLLVTAIFAPILPSKLFCSLFTFLPY